MFIQIVNHNIPNSKTIILSIQISLIANIVSLSLSQKQFTRRLLQRRPAEESAQHSLSLSLYRSVFDCIIYRLVGYIDNRVSSGYIQIRL